MPELLAAEDGQQHSPAALIYAALLHNKLPVEDGFFNFDAVSFTCTFATQHSHAAVPASELFITALFFLRMFQLLELFYDYSSSEYYIG